MLNTYNDAEDIKICNYYELRHNRNFICMFSGGKDSGLALAMALKKGVPVSLVHILNEQDNSLYHNQKKCVIEAQGRAMGIPVFYLPYKWWRNWSRACQDLKIFKNFNVDNIVFGDIRSKYIFLGDIPLCEMAGFNPCVPLGEMPYDFLMEQIEKHKLVSIITRINHPKISRKLLGVPFTRAVYAYMKSLNVDPFGEYDEFHTTLVDADFFNAPLNFHIQPKSRDEVSIIIDD